MLESICTDLPGSAQRLPMLIANGFSRNNDHVSHSTINFLDLSQKMLGLETLFRYQDNMWGIVLFAFPQRRGGGQPAGIASHRLYHLNRIIPWDRLRIHGIINL